MSLSIRVAAPADAATLARLMLHVQALHTQHDPQRFELDDPARFEAGMTAMFARDLAQPERAAWLAEIDATPAGYLFLEWRKREAGTGLRAAHVAYVHQVSVQPEYKRRGVARALFAAAETTARARGCESLVLDVHSAWNAQALTAFDALGFREARRVMHKPLVSPRA